MYKRLQIIAISIFFIINAQESHDEIDYLLSVDSQLLFIPNNINFPNSRIDFLNSIDLN